MATVICSCSAAGYGSAGPNMRYVPAKPRRANARPIATPRTRCPAPTLPAVKYATRMRRRHASIGSALLRQRPDVPDHREQPVVQDAVRGDHPRPQRRRLVEDERLALEPRHLAARFLDEERAGADVPLVLRRERERRVALAARQLGQLERDA